MFEKMANALEVEHPGTLILRCLARQATYPIAVQAEPGAVEEMMELLDRSNGNLFAVRAPPGASVSPTSWSVLCTSNLLVRLLAWDLHRWTKDVEAGVGGCTWGRVAETDFCWGAPQVMMNPKFQQLANKMMANPELMQMMQDPAMLQSVRASAPRPSTRRPSIADAAGVTAGPLQAMKSADDIGLTKELGLDQGQGAAAAKEFAAKACSPPSTLTRRAGPRPPAAARAGHHGAQRGRGCLAGDGCSQGGPGRGQGSARGGALVRHARVAAGKRG